MKLIHGVKPRKFKKYVDWRKLITIKDIAIEEHCRFADPNTHGYIERVKCVVSHKNMRYTEVVDIPDGFDAGACIMNYWKEKYCK